MATYYQILAAVKDVLTALPIFASATVKIRPSLVYNKKAGDTLPLVLVCPRRDTWEEASQSDLYMGSTPGAIIGYPVIIGVLVENLFDLTNLQFQMNARDAIREALWDGESINGVVSSVWDSVYTSNPTGVDLSGLAEVIDPSVQQFTYKTQGNRTA